MDTNDLSERVRNTIREIPNFPKAGINFYDITTVLQNGPLFKETITYFSDRCNQLSIDTVVGIEARGFIFGASVASNLGASFVPVRKPGKLPSHVEREKYTLEYGEDSLEIHKDALGPGHNVVLIDDLIATGGTALSTVKLIKRLGGTIKGCLFLIELAGLGGRQRIAPTPMTSLITYEL